ncbi:cadherin-13 [Protopterus annectens]|uniref:cadherin-13 n=1 Tax=Protopterus annectens TaxID=7888 RepID=UPI001CFA005F|nr:cadherin-13 [Protopterus annectens]
MKSPLVPSSPAAKMEQGRSQLMVTVALILAQVLMRAFAEDIECRPGFQQKSFSIEQPSEFIEDEPVVTLYFDDCSGNEKLTFDVSNSDFKVDSNGTLIAIKNVTDAGRAIFIHARTTSADEMAEVFIHGGKERPKSILKERFENSVFFRQKRSLVVSPLSIPEKQMPPFPKFVGKVIWPEKLEGFKFHLSGVGVDLEPKGTFKINEDTGDILVTRELDREKIASYQLQVEATDITGKRIEGPVHLDISVIDQNDNRPSFREGPYTGYILEGSPTGTSVMHVRAEDADDPLTANAALRYSIIQQTPDVPSPNLFYIDPEKGDIVTVVSPTLLDRETLPTYEYELLIEARDMAGTDVGLTGTATATIVIKDKNDHAPQFTKEEFQASVTEGVTGVIVNLTVEDKDDTTTGAWRTVYTIINGNVRQSFEIHTNPDSNEGMLTVVKPLDYEYSAFHTLLIKVENEDPLIPDVAYGPRSTATVQITVLDANEPPIFYPDPVTVTKQENIAIGSVISTMNATDPDHLQHQAIQYSVHHDPAHWLNINPKNGIINTTAMLDRESPFVKDNTYTASFLAIDSGTPPATGTGTLIITLEDVNDNPPSVHPDVAKVCEDSRDLNVVILSASDKDISPNTDPFRFELNKQTGTDKTWKISRLNNTHAQLSLLQNLKKANYNVPVVVSDSGKPPLSNSTEIKVQVCSCKKNKMDCSSASALHISVTLLIFFSIFSLFCL